MNLNDVLCTISPFEPINPTSRDNNEVSRRQTAYLILHQFFGCTADELTHLFGQDVRQVTRGIRFALAAYAGNVEYANTVERILYALRRIGKMGSHSLWEFPDAYATIIRTRAAEVIYGRVLHG